MRSLRSLLTVTYLGITFVSTVLLGVCLLYAVERSYVRERRQELEAHAEIVREQIATAIADHQDLRAVCRDLSRRMRVRVMLTATDGKTVVDTGGLDLSATSLPVAPQGRFGCHFCHSETVGARHLRITVPLPPQARAETVTLLQPTAGLERTTRHIRKVTLLVLLATLAIMSLVSTRLSSRLTSAILELNRMARRMAEGNLDQEARVKSRDEIGGLAVSFNEMAGRIRRSVNALAEEKAKLETVVAEMADGLIVTDTDGRIVVLNPACERIFGVAADTVIGRQVYDATFNPGLQRAIADALAGEHIVAEMRIRYPSLIVVQAHISPFSDAEGNTQGVIVVVQDRTEAHRLTQSQRDFVANVSHELRTPIASMHTTAQALVRGAKNDPALRDRFLDALLQETGRLSSLVEDLLALSRIEAQAAPLDVETLDVKAIVAEVLRMLGPPAGHRKLNITTKVPASLVVAADRTQLTQALANLVDNAIKYTLDGGSITVEAHRKADQVAISVADTGVGIPEEEQERVFERFYRVDKARSRDLGGTGLGLAIARQVATAHGGAITLESAPGRGSRFTITIPRVHASPAEDGDCA